jgi:hypothetical protein
MRDAAKYVVLNEHTLCYRIDGGHPSHLGILNGSVLRGGHSPLKGWVYTFATDVIRPATRADFETFRVYLSERFKKYVKE